MNLKDITLVTVTSVDVDEAVMALELSSQNLHFGSIKLLSSQKPKNLDKNIEFIEINELNLIGYSKYILNELGKHIDTNYCLIVQADGFVINSNLWTNEFLNYDYIGATWPKQLKTINPSGTISMNRNRVGNGGFSLRSKKLLNVCEQIDFDKLKLPIYSEDLIICHFLYDLMLENGINFAPIEIANKFSIESIIDENKFNTEFVFGFHGKYLLKSNPLIVKIIDEYRLLKTNTTEDTNFIEAKNLFLLGLDSINRKNYIQAEKYLSESYSIIPNRISILINYSVVLIKLNKINDAINILNKAKALEIDNELIYLNLSNAYNELKNTTDAIKYINIAIKINPKFEQGYLNLGLILKNDRQFEESLNAFSKAINLNAGYAEAYLARGQLYEQLKMFELALDDYLKAFELNPELDILLGQLLFLQLSICCWINYEKFSTFLLDRISEGHKCSNSFTVLSLTDSLKIHQKASEVWVGLSPEINFDINSFKHDSKNKISIAYYSADFKEHPVGYLLAELIELHDRDKFNIFGISLESWPQSPINMRLRRAFDQFIEVNTMTDLQIAELSKNLKVDIAIDLQGHTHGNRFGIFNNRAAPIQVNFLGYPGTLGSNFIDYIIADNNLIPEYSKEFYNEKICYLPASYMPFDNKKKVSSKSFTRRDLGINEDCFIFASFNNSYKINPDLFVSWMRILGIVDKSILLLSAHNNLIVSNLKNEAIKNSINPERLVFLERLQNVEDHLERQKVADLMLDTFPYNGHTTTIDALWSGVPVLTLQGEGFHARVASSLLYTVGLTELIVTTQRDYELKAIEMGFNSDKLQVIRSKLSENKVSSLLFNTPLYTKNLEEAFDLMFIRLKHGLPPEDLNVNVRHE